MVITFDNNAVAVAIYKNINGKLILDGLTPEQLAALKEFNFNNSGSDALGDDLRFKYLGENSISPPIPFPKLTDVPQSYDGATSGRHIVVVKADGSGLEFKVLKNGLFDQFNAGFGVTIRGGPFNGQKTTEKGYGLPGLNVSWSSADPGVFPITNVTDLTMNMGPLALDPGWDLATGGTYSPENPISEAEEGSGFSVKLYNNSESLVRSDAINWVYRVYWGDNASASLNESQVKALAHNALQPSRAATYAFEASPGQYKYVAYPVEYGLAAAFIDPTTNFEVPMVGPQVVTITNTYSLAVDYYVYRSFNQLGGALSIRMT